MFGINPGLPAEGTLRVGESRQDESKRHVHADVGVAPLDKLKAALESCERVSNAREAFESLRDACAPGAHVLDLEAFADPALLRNMPREAWAALDEHCAGVMTLALPCADGIIERALPAFAHLDCFRLSTMKDINLAKLLRYPAWKEGRRPRIELGCINPGIQVIAPSGTRVTGRYLQAGRPRYPSIVSFVHEDGSPAERARLLAGMEGDAHACLRDALERALARALPEAGMSEPAHSLKTRAGELADQFARVALRQGEVDLRRLYRDDRACIAHLGASGWHALRAISLGQGFEITRFDCAAGPAPHHLEALEGLECVVLERKGVVDLTAWQDALAHRHMPRQPIVELRCGGAIDELRTRTRRVRVVWESYAPHSGMPRLIVDGKQAGAVPGIPYTNNPLDAKGHELRRGDAGYEPALAAANENRNGKAFFQRSLFNWARRAIECRHLAVAWCRARQAHLRGPHGTAPFSYAAFSDERAIAAHVGKGTEGFEDSKAQSGLQRPFSPARLGSLVSYLAESLAPGAHDHFYVRVGEHALGLEIRHLDNGRFSATVYDPNHTGRDVTREFGPGEDLGEPWKNIIDRYTKGKAELSELVPMDHASQAFLAIRDEFVTERDRRSPAWLDFQVHGRAAGPAGRVASAVFSGKAENVATAFAALFAKDTPQGERIADLREALTCGLERGARECVGALIDLVMAALAAQLSLAQKRKILALKTSDAGFAAAYAAAVPGFAPLQRQAFFAWGTRLARMAALDKDAAKDAATNAAMSVANVLRAAGPGVPAASHARGYLAAIYCGALSAPAALPEGPAREAALRAMLAWLLPTGPADCRLLIDWLSRGEADERRWAFELAMTLHASLPAFGARNTAPMRELFSKAFPPGQRVEPAGTQWSLHRDCSLAGLRTVEVVWPSHAGAARHPLVRCQAISPIEAFERFRAAPADEPRPHTYLLPAHLLRPTS